jgi:undecaprenyl-diphosphatase
MVFFLALGSAPLFAAWLYGSPMVREAQWPTAVVPLSVFAFTIPLILTESFGKRMKGMFDWNWLDSLLLGAAQVATLLPGSGRVALVLPFAILRHYTGEAAVKYTFYLALPWLSLRAVKLLQDVSFQAPQSIGDLSWLSFGIAILVTFVIGLMTLGWMTQRSSLRGMKRWILYRLLIAGGIGVSLYLQSGYL